MDSRTTTRLAGFLFGALAACGAGGCSGTAQEQEPERHEQASMPLAEVMIEGGNCVWWFQCLARDGSGECVQGRYCHTERADFEANECGLICKEAPR
jgi:hypothetical protein